MGKLIVWGISVRGLELLLQADENPSQGQQKIPVDLRGTFSFEKRNDYPFYTIDQLNDENYNWTIASFSVESAGRGAHGFIAATYETNKPLDADRFPKLCEVLQAALDKYFKEYTDAKTLKANHKRKRPEQFTGFRDELNELFKGNPSSTKKEDAVWHFWKHLEEANYTSCTQDLPDNKGTRYSFVRKQDLDKGAILMRGRPEEIEEPKKAAEKPPLSPPPAYPNSGGIVEPDPPKKLRTNLNELEIQFGIAVDLYEKFGEKESISYAELLGKKKRDVRLDPQLDANYIHITEDNSEEFRKIHLIINGERVFKQQPKPPSPPEGKAVFLFSPVTLKENVSSNIRHDTQSLGLKTMLKHVSDDSKAKLIQPVSELTVFQPKGLEGFEVDEQNRIIKKKGGGKSEAEAAPPSAETSPPVHQNSSPPVSPTVNDGRESKVETSKTSTPNDQQKQDNSLPEDKRPDGPRLIIRLGIMVELPKMQEGESNTFTELISKELNLKEHEKINPVEKANFVRVEDASSEDIYLEIVSERAGDGTQRYLKKVDSRPTTDKHLIFLFGGLITLNSTAVKAIKDQHDGILLKKLSEDYLENDVSRANIQPQRSSDLEEVSDPNNLETLGYRIDKQNRTLKKKVKLNSETFNLEAFLSTVAGIFKFDWVVPLFVGKDKSPKKNKPKADPSDNSKPFALPVVLVAASVIILIFGYIAYDISDGKMDTPKNLHNKQDSTSGQNLPAKQQDALTERYDKLLGKLKGQPNYFKKEHLDSLNVLLAEDGLSEEQKTKLFLWQHIYATIDNVKILLKKKEDISFSSGDNWDDDDSEHYRPIFKLFLWSWNTVECYDPNKSYHENVTNNCTTINLKPSPQDLINELNSPDGKDTALYAEMDSFNTKQEELEAKIKRRIEYLGLTTQHIESLRNWRDLLIYRRRVGTSDDFITKTEKWGPSVQRYIFHPKTGEEYENLDSKQNRIKELIEFYNKYFKSDSTSLK